MTITKVATRIYGKTEDKGTGEMRLYKLDPPMEDYDGNEIEYVIVSATTATTGPETYIFPADAGGDVTNWGELDGSFRGEWNHNLALLRAGYEVVEEVNA